MNKLPTKDTLTQQNHGQKGGPTVRRRGLFESERRYATLVANLPGMAYRCLNDPAWSMELVSDGCLALTGYAPADLVDNHRLAYCDLIHPDDRRLVRDDVQRAIASDLPFQLEYRIHTRDGSERWVWEQGRRVTESGAEPVVLEGIVLDSSRRRQAEDRLRTLSRAVEQSPVAVMITDPAGTIGYVNPRFSQVTGHSAETVVGESPRILKSGLTPPETYRDLWETISAGRVWSGVLCNRRLDGEVYWAEASISPVRDPAGQISHFIGIQQDITERRRIEEHINLEQMHQAVLGDLLRLSLGSAPLSDKMARCLDRVLSIDWLSLLPKGAVFLAQPDGQTMELVASKELPPELVGRCALVPWGRCLCGRAAQSGELQYTPHIDERHEVHYPGMGDHGHYTVPMLSDGRVLGVLCLYVAKYHAHRPIEDQFLTAVGNTLAVIVEKAQAQEALRRSEERFQFAVEGASDGLWDWNPQTDEVWMAPRFKELLGYADAEMESSFAAWESRLHPDDRQHTLENLRVHLEQGRPYDEEYRLRNCYGEYRWFRARGQAVRDERGRPLRMAGSIQDVTDRKRAQEQLVHDALHDSLTGLPNRLLLTDRLEHVIELTARRRAEQAVLLFLDLDRFKVVNDSLGHLLGDQILVEVGQRFAATVRNGDTLARFGGDEFALLLEHVGDLRAAERAAERIQRALADPLLVDGREVYCSASVGIATVHLGYGSAEEVVRDADTAMYRAKRGGGGRCVAFTPDMREGAVRRFTLEHELRRAVETEELYGHYQPIVRLADACLQGVETLARWEHPQQGAISPSDFVPVAEETGLIIPLGQLVLTRACQQMADWLERFGEQAPAYVSVNLSARQLVQPKLVERIGRILDERRLAPQRLRLEITESAIMEQASTAAELLPRLKALGISLCMDDFGTGYSSLSYLHRFPLDMLKIDRSFIGRLNEEAHNAALVDTIVTLADKFGMQVIAEGVETADQVARLRAIGCAYAQGYYFSRPRPAAEIEQQYLLPISAPSSSSRSWGSSSPSPR